MVTERDKMEKAREVLIKIAKGTDPLTGETLKEESFLNDPRVIRCFYYIAEVLDNVLQGKYSKSNKLTRFVITPEQKSRVKLPEGKIGVNEFSRCVDLCIDGTTSRKLTGVELNRRLKKMGVLSEEKNPQTGRTRTITNERSEEYGFESEKKTYNGAEYDAVVMNDKGKQYLLDNLEDILNMEEDTKGIEGID